MERSKQIRYFLFSQYFSDGVRITLEIIIPALLFAYLGQLETGLLLSLGSLCVSISDGPGPVVHKRNGMLFCNLFIFISALLTGFLNHNPVTLGILILIASFFFTMFSVYGNRATSVGFAALLIMILQMTQMIPPSLVLKESLLILSGGIWYMVVALLFFRLTPYRPAKRSIAECLKETAKYLLIKAEMYNTRSDLQQEYLRLLDQQVVVNESQNAARELLYKNRALLKESTLTGRMLVFTFVDSIDLFEHIMATGYDYEDMRKRFTDKGVLNDVSLMIKKLAEELNNIGDAIQSNSSYLIKYDVQKDMESLRKKIDDLSPEHDKRLLQKILVNLENLSEKIDHILNYFKEGTSEKRKLRTSREYSRFVSQQDISWKVFKNNLTLKSSIFRHSLRVMITCGAGYVVSKFLPHEHHSYWIVMTIIIILKPAFSLTKQKNADRLLGTIGGGIIGLLLLYFIHDKVLLFGLLVFFMLGTYTFKIMNYIVMVIFLTPYILILFHFLGLGALNVAGERLLDTTIGSVLAALGSYFLFPVWESSHLQKYMCNVLEANIHYLEKLRDLFSNNKISTLDYKVVRKDLFVSTANLASALHRMQSEPKNKQKHKNEIYEFVVLNNLLSSNIASLTSELMKDPSVASTEVSAQVENLILILKETLKKLDNKPGIKNEKLLVSKLSSTGKIIQNKWNSQFEFITKLVLDIQKVTNIVAS
jgi:uncharacterized membrane protein (TIGR01666 family)